MKNSTIKSGQFILSILILMMNNEMVMKHKSESLFYLIVHNSDDITRSGDDISIKMFTFSPIKLRSRLYNASNEGKKSTTTSRKRLSKTFTCTITFFSAEPGDTSKSKVINSFYRAGTKSKIAKFFHS